MSVWVALLRGINVGGKNRLAMRDLVQVLENLNLSHVQTYIQSGNAVFQARGRISPTRLARDIEARISSEHSIAPQVMLVSRKEWEAVLENNPFPQAEPDPSTLHVFFLSSVPKRPDLESLRKIATATEQFHWAGQVFYLHAPDGIGRSKLAARIEQALGVAATGRNWRTVTELARRADAIAD